MGIVPAGASNRRGRRARWCLVACLGLVASTLVATPLELAGAVPPDFEDTLVANVSQPMDIDWTPDGRALVPTKPGQIRIIQDGTLLPTPALNLSPVVCTALEQGMSGLAVHPEFATNRYIYIYYTYAKFGACGSAEPVNRLSRFVLPPSNIIDPSSELVLMDTPQVWPGGHHNAGDIEFGPDGNMYVTIGDGNNRHWAANLGRLQGKIIRITDEGDVPPGNSYTGAGTARCNLNGVPPPGSPAGTKCQEIYATGLRNPFRLAPDPNSPTTRFFVNDVGENLWEEIDEVTGPGEDFGWPAREGPCVIFSETSCNPATGLTDPVHWYPHAGGGAATGGAFVPNGLWPAEYDGQYLFADYVFGKIYRLDSGGPDCRLCIPPTSPFSQNDFSVAPRVVEMAFGPYQGTEALYYVSREGSAIRRIVYTGSANRSPTAVTAASQTGGALPLTVSFDGSGSSDPDLDPLRYAWDFGDGSPIDTSAAPSHTFSTAGIYVVSLTVDDGRGGTNTATMQIEAGDLPPVPVISTPTSTKSFSVGEVLTLAGSASDPEDGPLADVDLTWEVRQHHGTHSHPYLDPTVGNNIAVVAPEPEDLNAAEDSYLEVLLTATDSNGTSATVSQVVQPKKVNLTFDTVPAGRNVVVEGQTFTAPTTLVGWQGWKIDVDAPDQLAGSVQQNWTSWSDGGSQAHEITVGANPATYSATFVTGTGVVVTPGLGVVTEVDTGSLVVEVPVSLNRPSETPVTVNWTTLDLPTSPTVAHPASDYEAASGVVTFAPGQTTASVQITVRGDLMHEPPLLGGEWGLIWFSEPSANATLDIGFLFGVGVFVIADNDPVPTVKPSIAGVTEGNAGPAFVDVPVMLSNPSALPITVDWTTVDNPGDTAVAHPESDYVAASGTLSFAPGETTQDIRIEVLGDTVPEPPLLWGEWGLVQVSNPTNATIDLSFFGLGVFVILDDD